MRKYRNVKVGKYDSKKEKNRADLLKILERQGRITNLKEQVKFELIPSQKIDKKVVERPCSYIADFTYCDSNGTFIVEDTKGVRTKDYVIKRKLMLHIHGIKIKEV